MNIYAVSDASMCFTPKLLQKTHNLIDPFFEDVFFVCSHYFQQPKTEPREATAGHSLEPHLEPVGYIWINKKKSPAKQVLILRGDINKATKR